MDFNLPTELGGLRYEDLATHIGASLRGKPATVLEIGQPRALEEAEVAMAAAARAQQRMPTGAPPEILRLRSRHHLIAQLLASGLKPTEVALRTGYSVSRISVLQADPTFRELLANYEGLNENLALDVKERLRLLSIEAVDELQQRLDEKPSSFENDELFKLAEMTLDRTGHGKSSVVQHTYGVDPVTAELLKANRPAAKTANLLEGEQLGYVGDARTERESRQQVSPQLELFAETSPDDPGPPPSGAFEEEAGDDPDGEVEQGAEIGAEVPRAVYEDGRQANTVVQFRPARFRSGEREPVDRV